MPWMWYSYHNAVDDINLKFPFTKNACLIELCIFEDKHVINIMVLVIWCDMLKDIVIHNQIYGILFHYTFKRLVHLWWPVVH